ncbi:MAG: hypothetical protein IKS49_08630 [Actinomycetaceae bacterium]|nr:hypothetical protein [Actinomycetaceae bacterium]
MKARTTRNEASKEARFLETEVTQLSKVSEANEHSRDWSDDVVVSGVAANNDGRVSRDDGTI